ncbi:hypothetical protein RJZ56_000953 [Blastomyces dermatitidis]
MLRRIWRASRVAELGPLDLLTTVPITSHDMCLMCSSVGHGGGVFDEDTWKGLARTLDRNSNWADASRRSPKNKWTGEEVLEFPPQSHLGGLSQPWIRRTLYKNPRPMSAVELLRLDFVE